MTVGRRPLAVACVLSIAITSTLAARPGAAAGPHVPGRAGTDASGPVDAPEPVETPDPAATSEPLEPVEVVSDDPASLDAAAAIAEASGGRVIGEAPGVLLVEVPDESVGTIDAAVEGSVGEPLVVDIRPESVDAPEYGPTVGQQLSITNALAWHSAGITGAGVKIGVIDYFDTRYWIEAESGALPVANSNAKCIRNGVDCTSEFFDGVDLGGEDHGVAVVEILRDMAPAAQIFVGQASTRSDYVALIDWFSSKGVTIISRSLGSRYDGPGDGTGPLDDIAQRAVDRGMLWVNSGGNNGSGKYYRQPVAIDPQGYVRFGPGATDPFLWFAGCMSLGGIRWASDWYLPAAQRTDYDVEVWRMPLSGASPVLVETATARQNSGAAPLEHVATSNCPPANSLYAIRVRYVAGPQTNTDTLEVLDYGQGMTAHTQAAYSAATPIVDSRSRGVLAVGAIDPPAGGRAGFYSAQGPTNDGRVVPDVVAPSGFASATYGEVFSGTSAAAPTVAGLAALLRSAGLATSPAALGDLVRSYTVDRGVPCPDNSYGAGEVRLGPPVTGSSASQPSAFRPVTTPTRILDTRPASAIGPANLIGRATTCEALRLPVRPSANVPADAVAVAVNVVTVAPDAASYMQVLPTNGAPLTSYSNLNTDAPGQVRSNFAIVPIGRDGSISIFTLSGGDVVVDLLGTFRSAPAARSDGRFVRLSAPSRVLDTRLGGGPIGSETSRGIPLPAGVSANQIQSLVVTVTAASAGGPGWLQVFPTNRPDMVGRTSSVNFEPGQAVANTAIVPVGGGVSVAAYIAGGGAVDAIVDVVGYITSTNAPPSTAGRYVPITPGRAFDSRFQGGPLAPGSPIGVSANSSSGAGVAGTASAVVWNLTVAEPTRAGHVRGWAANASEPPTSMLNWSRAGEVRASAGVTAVSSTTARFSMRDDGASGASPVGHLIVDVFGYFT